jgi:hypothetical protein
VNRAQRDYWAALARADSYDDAADAEEELRQFAEDEADAAESDAVDSFMVRAYRLHLASED